MFSIEHIFFRSLLLMVFKGEQNWKYPGWSKSLHKSTLNFYYRLYENATNGGNEAMFTSLLLNQGFLQKVYLVMYSKTTWNTAVNGRESCL